MQHSWAYCQPACPPPSLPHPQLPGGTTHRAMKGDPVLGAGAPAPPRPALLAVSRAAWRGRLGRQWARVPVLALGLAGLWQSATSPSGAWRETSRGAGADSLLSLCPSGTPGPTRASGSMSVGGTEVTTSSWPQRPPWLPSGGPSPALLRGRPLPGPGPFALLPASVLLVWPGWPLTPPPH